MRSFVAPVGLVKYAESRGSEQWSAGVTASGDMNGI
jgi:hypothetical protein